MTTTSKGETMIGTVVDRFALRDVLTLAAREQLPMGRLVATARTILVDVDTDAQVEDWAVVLGRPVVRTPIPLAGWMQVETVGVLGVAHVQVRCTRNPDVRDILEICGVAS
jgi:hypothetical protein